MMDGNSPAIDMECSPLGVCVCVDHNPPMTCTYIIDVGMDFGESEKIDATFPMTVSLWHPL